MKPKASSPRGINRPISALCLVILSVLCSIAQADETSLMITPIGSFGTLQMRGEHCEGQNIELWRGTGKIFGVLHTCNGLVDTNKTSVIMDQHYDQITGMMDFTSNFSAGVDYLGDGREVSSRDVWAFHGHLRSEVLSGVLTMTDKNYPKAISKIKNLCLRRRHNILPSFLNYDTWNEWANHSSGKTDAK